MGLPRNVRETTASIYRKALNKNMIRGRSIEDVISASVYYACRQCGIPRTLDEIASFYRGRKKEIGRTYRFIARGLVLKIPPVRPEEYISRFCSKLTLSSKVQAKVAEIVRDVSEEELLSGKAPTGIAAAAIYMAAILCNENRTQKEIANVTGVTEVTIRNRYKELAEKLCIEIKP